eukprot:445217-Alexandrium_andersonii.AAC.1
MSASLVGSEMCIRDRNRLAGAPEALFGMPGGRSLPGKKRCETSHGNTPVSYTHLTLPTICSV